MPQSLPVNMHDILKYLQENQAYLKTILKILEDQSEDSEESQKKNIETYRGFHDDVKAVYEFNKKIGS